MALALAPALAPPPKIPIQSASSDDYSPPKSLNPFLMPEQVPVPSRELTFETFHFWTIGELMDFSSIRRTLRASRKEVDGAEKGL